jgi:outer membrane protein OmpA-like peptidoglycan-associated protein
MKRSIQLLFFAAACLASPGAFAGGDGYKASDIVKFFEDQKAMAVTRGICVGTDEECAAASVKDHSTAFDLLVTFDKNSANLSGDARGNLIEFSVALRDPKLASLTFSVDGFTDASGGAAYNLDLSRRRAAAVVAFLRSLGVGEGMLVARGWGETNFRASDAYDPSNRRVETRILR